MRVELDPSAAAAAEARTALETLAGRVEVDVLDDLRLLVSELVTNCVRHSAAPAGSPVQLAVTAAESSVFVEVTDAGHGFVPRARTEDQHKGSGWGLHLVDQIAQRWGVDGPRVWFELDR
jgi:anti-sigma regulatory factor (Ser/Thr protein kinase)